MITWSQKLREKAIPSVKMLFRSLHAWSCSRSSYELKSVGHTHIPVAGDTRRGRNYAHFCNCIGINKDVPWNLSLLSIVTTTSTGVQTVISSCLVPSFLPAWVKSVLHAVARVAFTNHMPYMAFFLLTPCSSSPLV